MKPRRSPSSYAADAPMQSTAALPPRLPPHPPPRSRRPSRQRHRRRRWRCATAAWWRCGRAWRRPTAQPACRFSASTPSATPRAHGTCARRRAAPRHRVEAGQQRALGIGQEEGASVRAQKAAEQMAKQRERFAAMMDEEAAAAAPAAAASAEGGAPSSSAEAEAEAVTCIICHEGATESAFGFVGFAQPSCVLRRRPEESTGARLHLGLCGHAVHVDCLEKHVASLRQRANANAQFDGRAAVDIQKGEFLCPLCKRLSNTLVLQMCVSADEREPPRRPRARRCRRRRRRPAQRVLAFRRLLRPHLRRGDPRAEWPGFDPSRPRRRRRRRPRRRRLVAERRGDGAPFGMEAALAEAMAASEAIQAEAGRWRRRVAVHARAPGGSRGGDGGGARCHRRGGERRRRAGQRAQRREAGGDRGWARRTPRG